jgi:hypothetical protein
MKVFDDSAYRNKPGYIYLIHAKGTRRFKIGLTTRAVEARFNELNSSQSPYPLELLESIEVANVTEAESYLHSKFAFYRKHNEWFEFDHYALRNVMKEYEYLETGTRGWFRLPSLPALRLPSLESFTWLVEADVNTKGLVLAGIGALWLMVNFVGCEPSQRSQQRQRLPAQSENR